MLDDDALLLRHEGARTAQRQPHRRRQRYAGAHVGSARAQRRRARTQRRSAVRHDERCSTRTQHA
eukprot:1463584-Pleurochrysis_carterae.AAC.1